MNPTYKEIRSIIKDLEVAIAKETDTAKKEVLEMDLVAAEEYFDKRINRGR